ncbi:MAG: hypothetical protein VKQ33_07220 [Candidatus Sericytochromatia bacterium]|nr:hypothetical protein [Candidatus Sericytochromatia bacterium]
MNHGLSRRLAALLTAAWLAAWPTGSARAWSTIEDHLPRFLVAVGSGTGYAWAAFEAAHARDLDAQFYRGQSPAQKLSLAHKNGGQWVPVAQLAEFSRRWQPDFETVAARLEPLTGLTDLRVTMWYCLDGRPWVFSHANGRPTLALNARHLLPYHPVRTRLRFSQAIFDALATDQPDEHPERMTLSRRLQVEGLRLAMARRAVPGLPFHHYLGAGAAQQRGWQQATPAIARAMLLALDGPESALQMEHFFGKGYGMPWPSGAGRYLAFVLAAGIGQERSPVQLGRMPSRDYMFLVRGVLEDLAAAGNVGLRPPD